MPENKDQQSDLTSFFETTSFSVDQRTDWVEDIADNYQDLTAEQTRKEKQKNDERFRYARIFVRLSTI